ncbi:hypothetical protein [uncultured Mediterranean phage]|nr:hypothetical protein [uncultured Mediterranean phage]
MTTQARELAKLVTNAGDVNLGDDISLASDGAVLNFGADSDVTLTHVADTGLLLNSSRQLQFGDSGTFIRQEADGVLDLTSDTEIEINATTVDINANVDISGNLVLGGNITIGDADSDDISFGGELTSHIIPNADDTYDLGSSTKQWRNAYVDGTLYVDAIDLDGTALTAFNTDAAQVFNESGNDVDFRVESNGNANMLFVDGGNDNILIGTQDQGHMRLNQQLGFAVSGNEYGGMSFVTHSATGTGNRALLDFNRSRNTTIGSHTVVVNGDSLGTVVFRGDDGDEFLDACYIQAEVDGTPGNGDMPGRLCFFTTPDGASSSTEKMRISSSGKTSWSAGGVGAVATQTRDFTFYTEGGSNGVAIHSNDHRIVFMGGAASSGAGMDTGYFQLENAGTAKIYFNANGTSQFNGGSVDFKGEILSTGTGGGVQIDNGNGVTVRETMAASSHAWQANTYNPISAGNVSMGGDSSGTSHLWFNSYDTGSKYSVVAGHSADIYHGVSNGQFVLRMSANPTSSNGEGITMLQRLYIDKDGTFQFHSAGTNDTTIKFYKGTTIKWWVQNDTAGSPGSDSFWIGDEENDNGVYVQQDGSSWSGISDERLKRNWTNLTGACDKLDTLTKVGTFNRRGKTTGTWSSNKEVGLSAQEVEAILPEIVTTGGDLEFASDDKVTGVKGMAYEKLVPLLVKAIQELNTRLKAVE